MYHHILSHISYRVSYIILKLILLNILNINYYYKIKHINKNIKNGLHLTMDTIQLNLNKKSLCIYNLYFIFCILYDNQPTSNIQHPTSNIQHSQQQATIGYKHKLKHKLVLFFECNSMKILLNFHIL